MTFSFLFFFGNHDFVFSIFIYIYIYINININGSGGSPAGDPRHDPFKQDKRVVNWSTVYDTNPLISCRVHVGFTGHVKIVSLSISGDFYWVFELFQIVFPPKVSNLNINNFF